MTAKFHYFEANLDSVVRVYIDTVMKRKDWHVIAVDVVKNVVILQRFGEEK